MLSAGLMVGGHFVRQKHRAFAAEIYPTYRWISVVYGVDMGAC